MLIRTWTYYIAIILILASITTASTATVPESGDTLKTNDSLQTLPVFYTKKIALALSGGGSRGFAQVGVLQALEEEQIPIRLIVGTSIGALIGGLYASGYTAAELKQMILDTDWDEIFFDRPARSSLFLTQKRQHGRHILQLRFRKLQPELPLGLTPGHQLTQRLLGLAERAPYHPYPNFDHLKIPFRAIATDLYTGRKVVFRDGSLVAALRASMSMPLIITPMEIEDMLLVDGGVQENIPVTTAIDEGAGIVLAVNTSAPGIDFRTPDIPWEIADRVTTIMQQDDNRANLKLADVIIAPDVATQNSTDFDNLEALIDSGYHAAKTKIPDIRAILDSHKITINNLYLDGENGEVKSINIQGNTLLSDDELIDLFHWQLPYIRKYPIHQMSDEQLYMRRILDRYRATGATQAWIENTDYDQYSGQLTLTINEGVITGIDVDGLEHTHTWGVLRDFPLKPGDIFQIDAVERGIRQIYASELFESVFMTTERTEHGIRILLQVKERETRQLRWGARADLERRGATFLEFLDDNLFGLHVRFDLFGKYGEKDELYQATLISDRVAQSYLSAEINGYHRRTEWYLRDFDHDKMGGYDFERSGGVATLGIQPGRWGQVSAGLRAERVLSSYVGQTHDLRLAMIEIRADIDTQDRTYFPTQGSRFSFLYQSSGKYLKSDASYVKTDWSFNSYLEVVHRHVLGFHFRWGVADATIPHSEKFRLGGQNSLLGLHEGELVGNARVNFGITYQFDLISRFLADAYLLAHYTTGGVWNGAEYSVHPDDFLQGVGASFGLNTILGPITATWGRLIQAGDYFRNDIFYLSVGHNF